MIRKKNLDLLPELVPLEGKRVLDAGCGDGGLARVMAGHGAIVTGIDTSPRQLAKAVAKPPIKAETYLDAVAQAMPFADASFDVVVFANSLHHLPVPVMAQGLAEAARVLVAGGLLYVSEPIASGGFFEVTRKESIDDIYRRIQEELRNQYSIGYVSDLPVTISEFRNIQLTVKKAGLTVNARNRYWAGARGTMP